MRYWGFFAALVMLYLLFNDDNSTSLYPPHRKQSPIATAKVHKMPSPPTSRKPAATTTPTTPFQKDIELLKKLKDCYTSHTCNYPDTDPRSYEIALGKHIQSELTQIKKKYSKDSKLHKDLIAVAKEFLMTGDGFVQEEAINILSSLPPSQESLVAITEGLYSTPDPKLIEQALGEFQRYMGSPWESQVHDFLGQTLATGAQFSAITVSEKIMPFVNSKSYKEYEQTLLNMTPGSRASKNLNAALKEYRRLQTGA